MKKFIFILSLLMCVSFFCHSQEIEVGAFKYSLNREGNNVSLVGGNISDSIIIPDSIIYRNRNFIVTSISNDAFYNKKFTQLYIPGNVRFIGNSAFSNCNISSITLSDGIESIGSFAFAYNNIFEIIIPNSVRRIDDKSFLGCENLKRIVIGTCMEAIHWGSFTRCNSIEEIICNAVKPPHLYVSDINNFGVPVFTNEVYQFATLRVPSESIEEYRKSQLWGSFHEILPIE